MATTFIEALVPSVHDTLSLREALSKLARKSSVICLELLIFSNLLLYF